jgi:hypothetical protein
VFGSRLSRMNDDLFENSNASIHYFFSFCCRFSNLVDAIASRIQRPGFGFGPMIGGGGGKSGDDGEEGEGEEGEEGESVDADGEDGVEEESARVSKPKSGSSWGWGSLFGGNSSKKRGGSNDGDGDEEEEEEEW